jgi:phosphoribosylformylglycinamidine cyclo-ligase
MLTYRQAGVDIDAGNELVRRIAGFAPKVGGFAGLVPLDADRFLVACTDGVGTKLDIAIRMNRFDTIGQDLVAMCVNDLVTTGATPLAFLDYYATGKLDVDQAEAVVKGIARACAEARCPLLGGETAEMPGFYPDGAFDLAGFAVGTVTRDRLVDGTTIAPGDVLVGLPSSGVHSNGYSLVRRLLADQQIVLDLPLADRSLGELLLEPTALYVAPVLDALPHHPVKGMAHVTGGGFENLDRMLPDGVAFRLREGSWTEPAIFGFLRERSGLPEAELRRTFNMGIGMALAVPASAADALVAALPGSVVFADLVEAPCTASK